MSVKIFAELNPWSKKRIAIDVDAGSIKDIIGKLKTGWPLSQARVCKNGEIIKDFSINARDGDTLWIKFVPYGGEGMKVGGWALMLVGAIIGVATSWTGIGAFGGMALFGAGLGLALGGQVLMNINIPSLNDYEKPDSDPSIRGAKNQSRPHGRIPVLFGRHRIYPDLAANSFSSIIDGKQYYTQLFCGGYKDCVIDISSFKLGDTPLKDFSQTKNINSIIAGADSVINLEVLQNGQASELYPNCVHEEIINALLEHEVDGADDEKIPGDVIRTTPDNTDTINVDIFFYNGLGQYNDKGELNETTVTVNAYYKLASAPDSAYQLLGYFNDSTNDITGDELKTKRYQITRGNLAPGKYNVKIERVTEDSTDSKVVDQVYLGSIRSYKTRDKDNNPVRPIRYERQKDLTIIALRVLATGKLNGVIESFNYEAIAKMPVYSGGGSGPNYWLQTAETQNPASALLYALQGIPAQQKVSADDIDWPSLEAFYTWCEEHEYFCNAYLSQSVTMSELLKMIGSTARADILRIDSKISVVQDILRPTHMQLFTPKNTIDYKIIMIRPDIPDAISLRFIDEDSGYAQNEVKIFNTPNWERAGEPETDQKVDLWGVTNHKQAQRIGMYNYGCMKNRPFVHTIDVDIEYLLCNKGDWVQYAGDIALAGTTQGRIKGLIYIDGVCVGIDTDEPIEMESGKTYAVRLRTSQGVILLKEVVFSLGIKREHAFTYYPSENGEMHDPEPGEMYAIDEEDNYYYEPQNIILFVEPLGENEKLKAGDIYAFGVRGYEVIDLIITDIQPGRDLTATLTCVEYAQEIFGVDEEGFELPPFVNKITPVSGAIDSGIVTPRDWKLFSVFHESIEEPPRPVGDGTNDGWHYAQTRNTIWQSTKMAPAVDVGEWGTPVNLKGRDGIDGVTPIWLTIMPQSKLIECDINGTPLVGVLPFTSQARLFNGNTLVSSGITWSLQSAPAGITINNNGLVTVAANASLNDETVVTVRARYLNINYDIYLYLTKEKRSTAPRYLGTVTALTTANATVTITKGPQTGSVKALQNDYILAVSAVAGQPAGSVFQWSGTAWVFRNATNYAELYMRCFKDGLDIMSLQNNTEWFGAVICQQLIAQKAFIEELSAQIITLKNSGEIKSNNYQTDQTGFIVKHDGSAEFNNIKTKGMQAVDMDITGNLTANVRIQGSDLTYPMYGAVRGAFKFFVSNGNVSNFTSFTGGIQSIILIGNGNFYINLGSYTVEKENLANKCVILATAYLGSNTHHVSHRGYINYNGNACINVFVGVGVSSFNIHGAIFA